MRTHDLRLAALSAAVIGCIPFGASAQGQLEEIVVTATRRETNLQSTPLSIQAFTAEQLELGGITNGRDLGIMVPNVVLNPGTGGAQAQFFIRGLPGVGLYVDGVWQDGFGFQQMNFDEMERVEVLRGPQGTLFGRNTNGGAVNMTTRRPGDEFAARVRLDVGDFNRRDMSLAVDVPITENLKTKFMGATAKNDGPIEGMTTPWDFGSQDDTILRADVLWEPTDAFSLRFTYNDEQKRGTDPRIHRATRYDNSKTYAYNIMLGAFQAQANAACAGGFASVLPPAAGTTAPVCTGGVWPSPPANSIGTRYTGTAPTAYTPATHTTNYPENFHAETQSRYGNYATSVNAAGQVVETLGSAYTANPRMPDVDFGPAQLGKWQTKSDSMEDGVTADLEYYTLNARWDITDNLNFEAILSDWSQFQRQVIDFDGTEFLITTDDIPQQRDNQTIELHLSGTAWNERINWLAGYYSLDEDLTQRFYRWGMWEFAVPSTSVVNSTTGFAVPPVQNTAYLEYVRHTASLLNLNGFSGGNLLQAAPAGNPPTLYPWALTNASDDALTNAWDEDEAWFGEVTVGVTEKLDLTFGARVSDKTGGDIRYVPTDAFRTPDPAVRPQGDPFAYSAIALDATTGAPQNFVDPDTPSIDTYKFSAAYQATPTFMAYLTYAEGFTSASSPLVTIGANSVISSIPASSCPERVNATQARICLPPELIDNTEIGIRTDWLDGRLRFNATYFDSNWDGMRISLLPTDASGNTQPFPYASGEGSGTADGFEFEVIWATTERLTLNLGIGLIDTNYIQAGVLTGNPGQASITGNYPGAPFAYAADESGTLGVQYDIPLSNGGHFLMVGNYGYMGDYARDPAYQRTQVDENGQPVLEPAYGILNTRIVYEPSARNYRVELWGKNMLDELYVNGGFDTRDIWGYDFSVVGRAREVGVSLSFSF
jgi:outer membrane receptor protein involved in Fe transport